MDKPINNPHDSFFRYSFTKPDDARDFLLQVLPKEVLEQLDLDKLELEEGSYIDEQLRDHLTDVLYEIPLRSGGPASIYCLFEHKSSPAYEIHLQLLRYMYERWQTDKKAGISLRPILPLVFYHGTRKWTIPTEFLACFDELKPVFHPYIPNFRYIFFNTAEHQDADLRQMLSSGTLQASILLLKYIYYEALAERLPEIVEPLVELPTEQVLDHLLAMVRYLTSATDRVSQEDVTRTIADVYQDAEEIMYTLAEQWRQEGEDKGREEGEAVVRKTILRILDSRFEIQDPRFESIFKRVNVKLKTCRLAELNDLVNHALEAFSLGDFLKHLPQDEPESVSP